MSCTRPRPVPALPSLRRRRSPSCGLVSWLEPGLSGQGAGCFCRRGVAWQTVRVTWRLISTQGALPARPAWWRVPRAVLGAGDTPARRAGLPPAGTRRVSPGGRCSWDRRRGCGTAHSAAPLQRRPCGRVGRALCPSGSISPKRSRRRSWRGHRAACRLGCCDQSRARLRTHARRLLAGTRRAGSLADE